MRGHAGLAHPDQNAIGGATVLGGKEDPRQLRRRRGNGSELVDPADDFSADRFVSGEATVLLMLFQ